MNAVDLFDSHVHLNFYKHRNKKWTQCAFYFCGLVKMAVTNAWIYYCDLNKSNIDNTTFLELLLREAVQDYGKAHK